MGNIGEVGSKHREGKDPTTLTHVVLKTPLDPKLEPPLRKAVFATGCYWGSEKSFWIMPGVFTTSVGNAGGTVELPSYEYVCSGQTGHAESVQVVWDSSKISFADLMRQFLQSHDPTQVSFDFALSPSTSSD